MRFEAVHMYAVVGIMAQPSGTNQSSGPPVSKFAWTMLPTSSQSFSSFVLQITKMLSSDGIAPVTCDGLLALMGSVARVGLAALHKLLDSGTMHVARTWNWYKVKLLRPTATQVVVSGPVICPHPSTSVQSPSSARACTSQATNSHSRSWPPVHETVKEDCVGEVAATSVGVVARSATKRSSIETATGVSCSPTGFAAATNK
mmetsp:Transcript_48124/g.140245  ORF Transcript_48124/g.140245 Transcript_48124/m.140245 type:complete len:202 (+) Transcript_48124:704-1309(+)